jgi:hypothetical protein
VGLKYSAQPFLSDPHFSIHRSNHCQGGSIIRLITATGGIIHLMSARGWVAIAGVCCEVIHISTTEQLNKLESGLKVLRAIK